MKTRTRTIALAIAMGALVLSGTVAASPELAKAKGCLNCHDMDKKKVGPAVKDIAAAKKPAAELVAKVKEGKGHPKASATDEEVKKLVDYFLSVK